MVATEEAASLQVWRMRVGSLPVMVEAQMMAASRRGDWHMFALRRHARQAWKMPVSLSGLTTPHWVLHHHCCGLRAGSMVNRGGWP